MSWIEREKTDFVITCGDGKSYTVNWLNAVKGKEFNVALYEFNRLKGTLAKRKQPKGRRYQLEILFQGEDHLDRAAAFDTSSDDLRPWTIAHPLYGTLTVQPLSMEFDNSVANITRIIVPVIETITEGEPVVKIAPEDKIAGDKIKADELLSQTYATQVQPTTKDIQNIKANNTSIFDEGRKGINNSIDTENYINAFNTAQSAVNDATAEPLAAMRQVQSLVNAPVHFADTVRNRVNMLTAQFTKLRDTVQNILTRNDKKLYENQGGTVLGAMALTTVTNFSRGTDYNNRSQVLALVDDIINNYDDYLFDLDSLQTANGGSPTSYIPDFDAVFALGTLVSYTVSNLFKVAGNSRVERVIYLEEDTTPVKLAHRLYGLKPDDSTITELMDSNNIGLNELFILKKGRRIIYYV